MKNFTTCSDAGSLKIGNENFQILIPNRHGDGITYVHLCGKEEFLRVVDNETYANFFTSFSGNDVNIYDYDCGDAHVVTRISGRFGVYANDRHVYIVKWEG